MLLAEVVAVGLLILWIWREDFGVESIFLDFSFLLLLLLLSFFLSFQKFFDVERGSFGYGSFMGCIYIYIQEWRCKEERDVVQVENSRACFWVFFPMGGAEREREREGETCDG